MGRRARAASAPPDDPRSAAAEIWADPRVAWIPVRHHSAGCALHVERYLREVRPVAVLVEGPEDLDPLVPWLVHPETDPPIVALVSFTDPQAEPAMRVRTSWPVLRCDPEWVALRVGTELGAEVHLIDAPVRAIHGARTEDTEGMAGESRWFHAVAARAGVGDFDAFWEVMFEADAARVDSARFFQALLAFAWGARNTGPGPVGEVTAVREAHLRWHVDQALARHPEGRIAVVTGAYHSVALPSLKGKRAKARADKHAGVLLAASSHRALAKLGVRYPAWAEARYAAMGAGEPPLAAATAVLVEAMRVARDAGGAIGTGDALGAVELAAGLAEHFGRPGALTADHVLDAVRAAYVKGALIEDSDPVLAAARSVLVGRRRGHLPDDAGRPPLIEDFWSEIRAHRIDLGDDVREVRCDMERQERHRAKSAFLHRCRVLGLPMFGDLPDLDTFFRGPDPVEGKDLHLLTERWGVVRGDDLDDVLLERTDQGETVAQAAASVIGELRSGPPDAARAGRALLTGALCRLEKLVPELLADLADALGRDGSFVNLVVALEDLFVLRRYPDVPRADADRLVTAAFERACLVLPSAGRVEDDAATGVLEQMVGLSRFAAEDGALDRRLLTDRLGEVARSGDAQALVRGGAWGLLSALGAATARAVGAELHGFLRGPLAEVRRGGAFLEGVLRTSRSTFLTTGRLLEAVHDVLARLPEEEFLLVLPDFRRAFSVFVPAEIERIGEQVAERLAGVDPEGDAPLSAVAVEIARDVDRFVQTRIAARARGSTC